MNATYTTWNGYRTTKAKILEQMDTSDRAAQIHQQVAEELGQMLRNLADDGELTRLHEEIIADYMERALRNAGEMEVDAEHLREWLIVGGHQSEV